LKALALSETQLPDISELQTSDSGSGEHMQAGQYGDAFDTEWVPSRTVELTAVLYFGALAPLVFPVKTRLKVRIQLLIYEQIEIEPMHAGPHMVSGGIQEALAWLEIAKHSG